MVSSTESPVLVIDPGSSCTRLGLAGNIAPSLEIQSAYARDGPEGERLFGDDNVNSFSPQKEIYAPVMDGIVHDWPAACGQWQYMANQMGYDLANQPLLITEQVHNPTAARAKAVQSAFEDLEVPIFSMARSPLCATFAAGRATSLVVQIGAAVASVTPIIDGVIATKVALHSRYAGDFLSVHVADQVGSDLVPRYQTFRGAGAQGENSTALQGQSSYHAFQSAKLASDMKQYMLQVSPYLPNSQNAPAGMLANRPVARYELPDGKLLSFEASERFALAEPLFKPAVRPLPGANIPDSALGISELIYQALSKLEAQPEVFITLLSNVILCGGGTQLSGVARRIENDLYAMLPNYTPRIYIPSTPLSRSNLVWAGASVLGSMNSYDRQWATKAEYAELGAEQLLEKHWK